MRILQIIDTLEAGGAERMAVNYANALSETIDFSGLVATRKEGALLNQVVNKVSYLYLNKNSVIDMKALFKLRKFVIQNKVQVVHAHGTSFFIAFLLKLTLPSIKLIWHDHYGDSEFLSKRPLLALKISIPFFDGIIAVNQKLKVWAEQKIKCKNVVYLPNFPSKENNVVAHTILKGILGNRIVCLANLRIQKNHFLLLEVAKIAKESHPDWSFHLVGKDFEDTYSQQIKKRILEYNLEETVFVYGSKQDIKNILEQSSIAILTSQSEGLPVALLEYGWNGIPVVVTNVGEMPLLIQDGINGFVAATNEPVLFYEYLINLMNSSELRNSLGNALNRTIRENYSEEAVIWRYLDWMKNSYK